MEFRVPMIFSRLSFFAVTFDLLLWCMTFSCLVFQTEIKLYNGLANPFKIRKSNKV